MQIFSFSPFGYEGSLVSVEVDLRRGIPAVDIVGLADGAVKESRERMRSAIRNSGYDFPPERVLISLSPADLRKEGAGFDLAIALSVLDAKETLDRRDKYISRENSSFLNDEQLNQTYQNNSNLENNLKSKWNSLLIPSDDDAVLVIGELELNGKVRPVRGIHAAVSTAFASGIRLCIVPSINCDEAREVKGMKIFGAKTLTEAFEALKNKSMFTLKNDDYERTLLSNQQAISFGDVLFNPIETGFEYNEIKNQDILVRGLQIAAAGGHNILAYGPPGCGKTLAMQRFPSLLPLLTIEEAQPVTRIYSLAGLLSTGEPLLRIPPFRTPHQTATIEGICGGGTHLSPGEISLAHNGVLFLDEAAEFKSSVLQMLRVPLESGIITLSRAGRSTVFPAQFQLLMATNPCPCGFFGSTDKICLCSAHSVEQYWKKFSAPLLDRIDIRVQVKSKTNNIGKNTSINSLSTNELRKKIAVAVSIQRKRQGKRNAHLSPSEITEFCKYTDEAKAILLSSSEHYGFSPRASSGCLKLARTIADMEGKKLIDGISMEEAVNYRKTEGGLEIGFGVA